MVRTLLRMATCSANGILSIEMTHMKVATQTVKLTWLDTYSTL